jgi:hypothetical protein
MAKPIPTTGGDSEVRITSPVDTGTQMTDEDHRADSEYLPMDVFVDSATRNAHFHFTPKFANRRKSRRKLIS